MATELIEVDYELIRQMRREGNGEEADKLIQAFHDSLKKGKKQLNNEILKQDRKMKKHYKLCTIQCCMKPVVKGSFFCEKCGERVKKLSKETWQRKKEANRLKRIEAEQEVAKQIAKAIGQ